MNAKHITNLKIENFRGFATLELDELQAVNLIVGQNNAGKTSLLEAVALVAAPVSSVAQALAPSGTFRTRDGDVFRRYFRWLVRDGSGDGSGSITASGATSLNTVLLSRSRPESLRAGFHFVHESQNLQIRSEHTKDMLRVRTSAVQQTDLNELIRKFGDAVRPRAGEELIHRILQAVDPRIIRVRVDPAPDGNVIAVDIGLSESIPLSQAGQGVYRVLAILSDLIGEKPQICLIDEIENGVHHTVLKQMWRGLAEISEALGVQIFATTHSGECLQAAHQVFFAEDDKSRRDFAVIQLLRVEDQVVGKVLNEARVDAALENEIELR